MNCDSIIFDLDGTLWDSADVVLKAWNKVLEGTNLVMTKEKLHSIMGLQLADIGVRFFPELDEEKRMELMQECCTYECELIRREGGRLFEGLEETLRSLSHKYRLFIVSNCQCGYIEAFLAYHQLGGYFEDTECAGATGLSKGENIRLVVERNGLRHPVYVGDTATDALSARHAGIPFIFAAYGFGTVEKSDGKIDDIRELEKLLS